MHSRNPIISLASSTLLLTALATASFSGEINAHEKAPKPAQNSAGAAPSVPAPAPATWRVNSQRELELMKRLVAVHRANKGQAVVDLANQVLSLNPKNAQALEYRGLAEYILQQCDKSTPDLLRAIELGNASCDAYTDLAQCAIENGRVVEAEHYFEQALKLDPHRWYLLRQMAELYTEKHEYQKAEEYFKKAMTEHPNNAENYMSLGRCHYAEGQYQKAVDDFTKAIAIKPSDLRFYSSRASAYKKLNQMDKYKADMGKSNQAAKEAGF